MEKSELRDMMMKEIDLLQGCISRMARCSFMCKGWAVTVVAVLIGLLGSDLQWYVLVPEVLTILCFWTMDSMHLRLERAYRAKYEAVVGKRLCGDDSGLFDLNPWNGPSKVGTNGFTCTLFSWSEAIYPAMIVGVVLYVLLSILME